MLDQQHHSLPRQLSTQERLAAAAGSALVASIVVNPLDVIKTRMQAHASASSSVTADSACNFQHQHIQTHRAQAPVRVTYPRLAHVNFCFSDRMLHHASCALNSCSSLTLHPHYDIATPPWPSRPRLPCCPVALTMSPGTCSSIGAGARASAVAVPAAYTGQGSVVLHILRQVLRKEGVSGLYRGLDGSLAMSVPMVSIYMPLYDHLMARLTPGFGAYSPMVAGVLARAVAVFAVAPLELARTRQQAGGAAVGRAGSTTAPSAWLTLRTFALASGVTGAGNAGSLIGVLTGMSRLWTGVSATLARDLPFSALYWGMVEPLRTALLRRSIQPHSLSAAVVPAAPHSYVGSNSRDSRDRSSTATSCNSGIRHIHDNAHSTGNISHTATLKQDSAHVSTAEETTLVSRNHAQPQAASIPDSPAPMVSYTSSQVLGANLLAGSIAGGVSAWITTPFDVIKTRMQIADPGANRSLHSSSNSTSRSFAAGGRSMAHVARHVLATEGVSGLYTGAVVRSLRAAPACALVIGSYELFKNWLQ